MNCLLCGEETLVSPIILSCGHCYCWPCFQEYIRSFGDPTNATCPIGRCVIEDVNPLYQGANMTREEEEEFGHRPGGGVVNLNAAPRRSNRTRRRNTRYQGYGKIRIYCFCQISHLFFRSRNCTDSFTSFPNNEQSGGRVLAISKPSEKCGGGESGYNSKKPIERKFLALS